MSPRFLSTLFLALFVVPAFSSASRLPPGPGWWVKPSAGSHLRALRCQRPPHETVEEVLRTGNLPCRFAAIHALRERGDAGAVEALWQSLVREESAFVREMLARNLIELGDRRTLPHYRSQMESASSPADKAAWAAELAALGDPQGLPAVLAACRTANAATRPNCVGYLLPFAGRLFVSTEAQELLLEILFAEVRSSDSWTRRRAANRLDVLSAETRLPPEALPRLRALAYLDREEEVRTYAHRALERQLEPPPSETEVQPFF